MIWVGLAAQLSVMVWPPLQLWRAIRAPAVEGVSIAALVFLGVGEIVLFAYAVSIGDPVFMLGTIWFASLSLTQAAVVFVRRRRAAAAPSV